MRSFLTVMASMEIDVGPDDERREQGCTISLFVSAGLAYKPWLKVLLADLV